MKKMTTVLVKNFSQTQCGPNRKCYTGFWQLLSFTSWTWATRCLLFDSVGHRRTVWIFVIAGTWIFIKDQWKFIYILVLILSVSFYYEVPSESACNPRIMKITTISFYAVSASPCQCLIRPVQRFKVSWFFSFFFHWIVNYTRGRAFRREISKIQSVA